jgi:hypothetical protein
MLKMKVAPDELLKTKGQKSALGELLKTSRLLFFADELLKGKGIARKF